MANHRLKLLLPNKHALLPSGNYLRKIITLGHVFLAINTLISLATGLWGIGIFFALLCFGFVQFKKNVLFTEALRFSYGRSMFVTFIFTAILLLSATAPQYLTPWQGFAFLILVLTPLSFYDAFCFFFARPTLRLSWKVHTP